MEQAIRAMEGFCTKEAIHMQHNQAGSENIHLGFTDQPFPPGTHICQIYSNDRERLDLVNAFIVAGLKSGDHSSYFSENKDLESLRSSLTNAGFDLDEALAANVLVVEGVNDIYFPGDRFDPDTMLTLLQEGYDEAMRHGFQGVRVIGDMSPEIERVEGSERLLEYESRVSLLLRDTPLIAVCQYSADEFSGEMIMDILKVHPYVIVRGVVVHNPYYLPPEKYLASGSAQ